MNRLHDSPSVDFNKLLPPLLFVARDVRFLARFPDGADELWVATIEATRRSVMREVFEDVLFVESAREGQGTAHIFGIEFEDGRPRDFNSDLAAMQQVFVEFLRRENAKDDEAMGWTRKLFTGREYACVARTTAAYLAARGLQLNIGVGYHNEGGDYELIAVQSEDWLEGGSGNTPRARWRARAMWPDRRPAKR